MTGGAPSDLSRRVAETRQSADTYGKWNCVRVACSAPMAGSDLDIVLQLLFRDNKSNKSIDIPRRQVLFHDFLVFWREMLGKA
jgi:hypothetical protein